MNTERPLTVRLLFDTTVLCFYKGFYENIRGESLFFEEMKERIKNEVQPSRYERGKFEFEEDKVKLNLHYLGEVKEEDLDREVKKGYWVIFDDHNYLTFQRFDSKIDAFTFYQGLEVKEEIIFSVLMDGVDF